MHNKVVLITGFSRSIGAAIAVAAKKVRGVVVTHGRTESIQLIALVKKLGTQYVIGDICNEEAITRVVEQIIT